ncbi:hypothetical protein HMPREF1076_00707 [Parabacteroides goldsteinii CL02T12C30]|uniref:Uncharacterized protein n=1 Tax=Parabacteroides goldsteinii CL02T12C30 TaxID=999418 RepID=K6A753_9BACT|nr:hypothetical protein [Parabacteroides goldsteinii]EKN19415.1 hypothetical protein HMPREF1076_00707 [Parabacteroides goldsteinii CL02T12C30]
MRELVFPGQKRALQRIQEMDQRPYLTREEKLEYDELLKFYRDCVNIIDYAYEQGRKKGFVLTLKERGIPIKEIATASGLSEEEINSL